MGLRRIAHDDPEMKSYEKYVGEETALADQLGLLFWLFIVEKKPIGLVIVGKEPLRLLAPIGTPLSIIRVLDYDQLPLVLEDFANEAMDLMREHAVDYAFVSVSDDQKDLIQKFQSKGFEVLEQTYRMVCPLDDFSESSDKLRFERVQRAELKDALRYLKEAMSGSPDKVLNLILKQLQEIPDQFLDLWYQRTLLFFVYKGETMVGVLDITPQAGIVSNLGVFPKFRGKGYGREIVRFGLRKIKENEKNQASLRVASDNKAAVGLYQSLGFQVDTRRVSLIWYKSK